ncbi:MAG: GNAT family N-acetyltransferase [Acidimicrobiia bacterium]|nr:GNAT family N-acetyltransferase [Acidimicrobiia bacterium]
MRRCFSGFPRSGSVRFSRGGRVSEVALSPGSATRSHRSHRRQRTDRVPSGRSTPRWSSSGRNDRTAAAGATWPWREQIHVSSCHRRGRGRTDSSWQIERQRIAAADWGSGSRQRIAAADWGSGLGQRIAAADPGSGWRVTGGGGWKASGVQPLAADAPHLITERLVLRRWRTEDLEPFAAMNADPLVTATLARPLSRVESDALVGRIEASFEEKGFGLWAVEVPGVAPFVGFVGLSVPGFPLPFPQRATPCVEVGWRLAGSHWGQGYATEGARAALDYGFDEVGLTEIVSFTSVDNLRSRAVMERLGMVRDVGADFDHPSLDVGHPLRRHVLYRIDRR